MPRARNVLLGLAAAPVLAWTAGVVAIVATGTHRRSGATPEEVLLTLPGDELFSGATIQNDRAITIPAPPEDVWPWIAQLGQDKAGFYSFTALENAIGCEITNATEIRPEWQLLEPGQIVPVSPEGYGFRVADVNAPHHLVLVAENGTFLPEGMDFRGTWAFQLRAEGEGTRLHLRERYEPLAPAAPGKIEAISVASALMTWKMLRTIKRLADA